MDTYTEPVNNIALKLLKLSYKFTAEFKLLTRGKAFFLKSSILHKIVLKKDIVL